MCLAVDELLQGLRTQARETLFDNIPFVVYIAFISLYYRFPDAAKLGWWKNADNARKLNRIASSAWPFQINAETKRRIASGCEILICAINYILSVYGDDDISSQLYDRFKVISTEWMKQLQQGTESDNDCVLYYLTQCECANICRAIKVINPSIAAFLLLHSNCAFGNHKLRQSVRKKTSEQLAQSNTLGYMAYEDSGGDEISALITSYFVLHGTFVFETLITLIESIKTSPDIQNVMKRACGTINREGDFLELYAPAITECFRLVLFFHGHGHDFTQVYDKTEMLMHFMARMDDENDYAIIQRRKLLKRKRDEGGNSDEGNYQDYSSEEDDSESE